jgi:hypothetical protein
VVLEAFVAFMLPELSAPGSTALDAGPATFLADHLGIGRFASLDAYLPNYGSYFGIASIDLRDDPVPKAWNEYVTTHLLPGVSSLGFDLEPGFQLGSGSTTLVSYFARELVTDLPAYEAVDTRYVLLPARMYLFGRGPRFLGGVRPVYDDGTFTIYALPNPRPYFSTAGSGCDVVPDDRLDLTVRCSGRATLIRAELDAPGWSVTINGRSADIQPVEGGLEGVGLPVGTDRVSFSYLPPYQGVAVGLLAIGLAMLVAAPLLARRMSRRQRLGTISAAAVGGERQSGATDISAGGNPVDSTEEVSYD